MVSDPRTTVGRAAIGAPEEDLNRFYAALDRALPDPVFVVGLDGRLLYMGASFEAITGIPAKSAIGQPAMQFIHADDRVSARAVFDRFWTMQDSRLVYEARVITATGEPRWLSASIRVTEWLRNERVLLGTLRDVTSLCGEVTPGAVSSDLRFVLDALPGIAYAVDASGDISYSTAALHATMYRGATSDGARDWLTQLHPDDAPAVRTAHRTGTERRMPFDVVGRLPRTDGAFRWFRFVATPRFDVGGAFLGHLVFLHDESVVREAEAAMRAQERTLVRLLDTMVVAVAVSAPDGTLLFTNEPGLKLVEARRRRQRVHLGHEGRGRGARRARSRARPR